MDGGRERACSHVGHILILVVWVVGSWDMLNRRLETEENAECWHD